MPRVQNVTLGGGQIAMLQAVTQLTAAQIASLSTTPITLVPAPGAGKLIVPIGVSFVYKFGTVAFNFPPGGSDRIDGEYLPTANGISVGQSNMITAATSQFAYSSGFPGPFAILPGVDNSALAVFAASNFNAGPIVTTTLGAGGAGYAANDTGTITTGNGDATYKVLTVGGGGNVLTYQITAPGTGYTTGAGQATAVGGAQPGVGAGFTVNITAVQTGDGTLKVVTYYQIIPVP